MSDFQCRTLYMLTPLHPHHP